MNDHINHTKLAGRLVSALAVLAVAGAAAAPATAKPVAYKGKTKAGSAIAFKRAGSAVTKLRTYVPVICVSTRTSDTRSVAESFDPPGRLRLGGGEQKVEAEQSVAVGMGDTATKTYRVTLERRRRRAIAGKLSVSFMAIEPYYNAMGYLDGNTFVCQGSTRFSARPR